MVGKCTRIEKIEIENFKNVKYGQVVLKIIEKIIKQVFLESMARMDLVKRL